MSGIKLQKITDLSSQEAKNRLQQYGKNSVEEKRSHRLLIFAKKLWSPVPWMLEITIILQLVLHKYDEAIIIFILLIFNSALSFFQEGRANKALAGSSDISCGKFRSLCSSQLK